MHEPRVTPTAVIALVVVQATLALAQTEACQDVFAARGARSSKDPDAVPSRSMRGALLRAQATSLLMLAEDIATGRKRLMDPRQRLEILRDAENLLLAHGIETEPAPLIFQQQITDGLNLVRDPKTLLGLIARQIQARSPDTRVVIFLEPGARGYIQKDLTHFGVSLETALRILRGDLKAMSVVIHEYTHFVNRFLADHPNDVVRARGQVRIVSFDAPPGSPLPGGEKSLSSYAKDFRFDELDAHETQARWLWREAIKLSDISKLPREALSPNFESLELLNRIVGTLAPVIHDLTKGFDTDLPALGESTSVKVGENAAGIRWVEITIQQDPSGPTPRYVVLNMKGRNAFGIPVSRGTLEIPLRNTESASAGEVAEVKAVLERLVKSIAFHQARYAKWSAVYHAKPETEPYTRADLWNLLEDRGAEGGTEGPTR